MRYLIAGFALCGAVALAAEPLPPPPPTTSLAFSEIVTLSAAVQVGAEPIGFRRWIPITGGTFQGAGLAGKVLPGSGDWQLVRADGSTVIEADYMIETDDGVQIHVHNQGVSVHPKSGPGYTRTVPQFEAPIGKYGWLNDAIFVGTITQAGDKQHPAVLISIYKVN